MNAEVLVSPLFDSTCHPDLELGDALAMAITRGSEWRHRKVESLRLLEGEYGRRRVSLDCTPPDSLKLSDESDRERGVLLPLAMISKGPMRNFDVTDASGLSLPVLGRRDDGYAAWSAICARFASDLGSPLPTSVAAVLSRIVLEPAETALPLADELSRGCVDGKEVFDVGRIREQTVLLLADLASNFLLIALLEPEKCNRRQVVKFAFHWHVEMSGDPNWIDRFKIALGTVYGNYGLEVSGASDAASYHLEAHAPPGLKTVGLELPSGGRDEESSVDDRVDVVAHAVGSYEASSPIEDATLYVAVPPRGLRTVTAIITGFTAAVFLLERLLPGAQDALLEAPDGAVALFLIVPAAFSSFMARPTENILLSYILLPLRMIILLCAALLVAGAASLVGRLHDPYMGILWFAGAATSIVLLVWQLVSFKVSVVRG